MSNRIIIIGGCAGAKVAFDIFSQRGYEACFADCYVKEWGSIARAGQPYVLTMEDAYSMIQEHDAKWFPAAGDNLIREGLTESVIACSGRRPTSAVHPSAIVSRYADVGQAALICAQAVVGVGAEIGHGVIVNTAASVDHDCRVGDFAQISPGARLCGYVEVGERAFIGAGATIIPHVKIGKDAIVAAGAVVTKDVEPSCMVAGVPATQKKVLAC